MTDNAKGLAAHTYSAEEIAFARAAVNIEGMQLGDHDLYAALLWLQRETLEGIIAAHNASDPTALPHIAVLAGAIADERDENRKLKTQLDVAVKALTAIAKWRGSPTGTTADAMRNVSREALTAIATKHPGSEQS